MVMLHVVGVGSEYHQVSSIIVALIAVLVMNDVVELKREVLRHNGSSQSTAVSPRQIVGVLEVSVTVLGRAERLLRATSLLAFDLNLNPAVGTAPFDSERLSSRDAGGIQALVHPRGGQADKRSDLAQRE